MESSAYNRYLSAIKTANDLSDKDRAREMLRSIQAELIAQYGLHDDDVEALLKYFRYNV